MSLTLLDEINNQTSSILTLRQMGMYPRSAIDHFKSVTLKELRNFAERIHLHSLSYQCIDVECFFQEDISLMELFNFMKETFFPEKEPIFGFILSSGRIQDIKFEKQNLDYGGIDFSLKNQKVKIVLNFTYKLL